MSTVLLVDDQEMIRLGLRAILDASTDFEVVADVADGFAALAFLRQHEVDLILMDIRMPGIDGVETTRRIRETVPAEQTRIVVLTTFEHEQTVLTALRAGANGFLGKGAGPAELIASLQQVVAGGAALSASASASLVDHVVSRPEVAPDADAIRRFEALTPRERDVVIAAAQGKTNDDIAAELYLSAYTVKTHANRAMAKAGVRDRAQLVALAYRAGLISPRT